MVSESQRAVEDKEGHWEKYEDNLCTAATPHLCYISLLLLPWVTCDKSAASLPNDFLLIYTLCAATDPTELEHVYTHSLVSSVAFPPV